MSTNTSASNNTNDNSSNTSEPFSSKYVESIIEIKNGKSSIKN
ncbi:MAG TPA: hypothetical protein VJ583_04765 [Nitrososphaeraceae archaeon]|nr:hypothetical protein [Nitrososphaeraceae archaeon]